MIVDARTRANLFVSHQLSYELALSNLPLRWLVKILIYFTCTDHENNVKEDIL